MVNRYPLHPQVVNQSGRITMGPAQSMDAHICALGMDSSHLHCGKGFRRSRKEHKYIPDLHLSSLNELVGLVMGPPQSSLSIKVEYLW
jgi:hypothetical protein